MAKKKATKAAPPPTPEPVHEVENTVDPTADKAHTALHGADSIVPGDDTYGRSYHVWIGGQRYVHVGEHNGQWVYRPDY